ncbi:LytR/AlgR family response regulator transcription factor [Aquimarina hainanensis]|uniref:LytR/AlgR family response regulator transcription factor n=1 Tax=Aquimarina hainanensis TaxID=1578017 RepID=A0ABW5N4W8_9FLAO|nr:LytTR family DNA-binding domain-containing protein [Aquimarina sp. TRL1]QKX06153.1 LytTR family transcriptional regulator [Aquimarina sp. TRL1]
MKKMIIFFKQKDNFLFFWVRSALVLVILSIVVNHLTAPENFPLNESYKFPWFPIVISILLGSIIISIAYFNFNYFKKTHFVEKINTRILLRFLFTTLGYISIVYTIFYFTLNGLIHGIKSYNFYHLLTGFSITLLLSILGITILFASDVYKLLKLASIKGKLKVEHAGKITLIGYNEIAFFFTENKIVYLVKTNGTTISTDFTLNEVEDKINMHSFFRANRQTILHARSIEQIQPIANGKLLLLLKPTIANQKVFQVNISRYKKQAFKDWFGNKI